MGIAHASLDKQNRLPVNRMKLSAFAVSYWPDEDSRPCTVTLKNHIRDGLLSGRKIGGLWFVECTSWNEPLFYNEKKLEAVEAPIPAVATGNAIADSILKRWCD